MKSVKPKWQFPSAPQGFAARCEALVQWLTSGEPRSNIINYGASHNPQIRWIKRKQQLPSTQPSNQPPLNTPEDFTRACGTCAGKAHFSSHLFLRAEKKSLGWFLGTFGGCYALVGSLETHQIFFFGKYMNGDVRSENRPRIWLVELPLVSGI